MTDYQEPRSNSLDLGELVDLELQLLRDRGADPAQLRRRDHTIGREICAAGVPVSRAQVLRQWLRAFRTGDAPTPGRRLVALYRVASVLLIVIGLVSGASAAAALLRYDGEDPVNVISYLAILVGLQLLLALLAGTSMLPLVLRRRLSPLGPLHAALRELGIRRAGFDSVLGKLAERTGVASATLAQWGSIYGEAERWRLLAITGRAAVAFNVGALVASFYRVAASALAFAWSTTLDVDAATVHAVTGLMSLPWAWVPDAVPSLALIEASRYFPGGTYDPALLGDWWPFLLASLLAYGLLPRTVLWLLAERRGRVARAAIALDHGDARLLYERLTGGWDADPDSGGATVGSPADSSARGDGPKLSGTCRALLWADVPLEPATAETLVRQRTGCTGVVVATDKAQWNTTAVGGDDAVVVVAEGWEAPTRALGRLLTDIRSEIAQKTPIVVLLTGGKGDDPLRCAAPADARIWRRHLGSLGDPYLFVDSGAPEAK